MHLHSSACSPERADVRLSKGDGRLRQTLSSDDLPCLRAEYRPCLSVLSYSPSVCDLLFTKPGVRHVVPAPEVSIPDSVAAGSRRGVVWPEVLLPCCTILLRRLEERGVASYAEVRWPGICRSEVRNAVEYACRESQTLLSSRRRNPWSSLEEVDSPLIVVALSSRSC